MSQSGATDPDLGLLGKQADLLRLEADDDEVLALTIRALVESRDLKPSLDIHCSDCGVALGRAGRTLLGVVFVSWWDVEVRLDFELHTEFEVQVGEPDPNERRSRRRHAAAADDTAEEHIPAITHTTTRHGVIALLTLPEYLAADYPDLLVRCAEHGDGILDREQVVDELPAHGRKRWKVPLRLPHLDYRIPRPLPEAKGVVIPTRVLEAGGVQEEASPNGHP